MLLVFLLLICCSIAVYAAKPSLAIAMMCRDEEVNLKTNLELWLPYVDYFVFVVDVRTIDKSVEVIKNVMASGKKQYMIVDHEFVGFGHARSVSLKVLWDNFPQATHVLIADPDWIPRLDTINLQELEVDAEVYRFVVFDRNGQSRRKMDWLLKHRQGLAMKYHLHEVLDIGPYKEILQIGWVIDEIEKLGTWHATVGHQHSMSLKRLLFDLEMLYKDEALYSQDAHTDYYLGITNQAVADLLIKQGEAPGQYLEEAVYYMNKRINSRYEEEFVDERWASMYLLALTYVNLNGEYDKGVHMFNMCRDFNPASLECAIALSRIYLSQGVFDLAMNELTAMLKQETREREYLTHFKQNACEIPELVVTLFKQKALANALNANEAKYMLLMNHMVQNKMCGISNMITEDVEPLVNALLKEDHSNTGTPLIRMRISPLTVQSSVEAVCANAGLQSYLLSTRYLIHPCDSLRAQLAQSIQCTMFSFNLPPANEEMQANSEAKEFVGAALMTDIIHYVYNGNSGHVFNSGHTFRFLFASYFNPKIIYNLIGFFDRTGFTAYEIVVVADESVLNEIKNTLQACSLGLKNKHVSITYSSVTAAEYLRTALAKRMFHTPATMNAVLFDYIEYNGAMSVSSNYETELADFKQLLQPKGVIGMTYFAKNHHVDKIRKATSAKNTSALAPFSLENSRFIKSYLELNGMSFLTKDQALLLYLGAESSPSPHCPVNVDMVAPSVDWKGYSQSEVLNMLEQQGLRVVTWMPRAYAHPFDNIGYHQIQKFADMGMSQEQFVEEYLTFFRYTVYVQSSSDDVPPSAVVTQKAVVSVATLSDQALADKVLVIDRLGALSSSFAGTLQRAANGLATTFAFAPYSLTGRVAFNKIVLPGVTACMTQMSSGLSVWQLHQLNVKFSRDNGANFTDETPLKVGLVSLLSYLEMVNAITFLCDKCDVVVPPSNTTVRTRGTPTAAQDVQKASVVVDKQGTSSGSAESASSSKTVKIGGINFKVNEKTVTAESAATSSSGSSSSQTAASVSAGASSSSSGVSGGGAAETVKSVPATSGPKYTPLDTETQIKRMKALGFSDAKIAETLAKRAAFSKPPPAANSASTADSQSAGPTPMASQGPSDAVGASSESRMIEDATKTVSSTGSSEVKSDSTSAAASSSTPKYTPLDTETQIKRMKALGFSDAKIADTLAKRAASKANAAAASSTTSSTTGVASGSTVTQETKPQTEKTTVSQSPPPKEEAVQAAPATAAVGATKEDTSELKKKLKGILNLLADKDKKAPVIGTDAATTTAASAASDESKVKLEVKPLVRPESDSSSSVAGGLLQKRALENKAKQEEASTKSHSSTTAAKKAPAGANTAAAPPSLSDSEIVAKVKQVKLPTYVQSRSELIASYRRIECFHLALDSVKLPMDCQLSGPVKRKTSMLGMVSIAKLEFDIAQFKYLQRQGLLSTRLPLIELTARYQEVTDFVNNRKETERKKLAKMALSPLPATSTGMLNRVVQVSTRDADPENLVHLGAVKYIQSIADALTADFTVVDVLLKDAALAEMTRALLTSTIWFDTTNGFSFVSHHDDGLVLESIRSLTQYIAFSVSTPAKQMKVVKYYTVAMSLDRPGNSSIAMANGEELVAILWLNPTYGSNTAASVALEGQPPVEDGLRIFDDFAAGRLYSQGVSIYPSAHSDFFSKSGDLLIDMAARCNMTNSELVPRKTNRLVLLQPKRPFYFTVPSPSTKEVKKSAREDEFESKTMLALVVFLGK